MGVPSLFKYLAEKYPKILSKVIEEFPQIEEGVELPIDFSSPNPNNIEFDNLYLGKNKNNQRISIIYLYFKIQQFTLKNC